jgi:hypothetical protein
VLAYRLINSAGYFDISSVADGDDNLISVAPATSATYTDGDYQLLPFVDDGTDRITLTSLSVLVLPDLLAATTGVDSRSHARRMLDAIQSALESFATGERLGVVEAALRERNFKYDFQGLTTLRDYYQRLVRNEEDVARSKAGKPRRNKINVRL